MVKKRKDKDSDNERDWRSFQESLANSLYIKSWPSPRVCCNTTKTMMSLLTSLVATSHCA